METFFKGLVMGFCIAAPVGPIGLLCIRRSIADGQRAGFVTGLGAATADALYGFVAALGLTVVAHFLVDHRSALQIFGGVFLVYLGVSILRTPHAVAAPGSTHAPSLVSAYGSTLLLTLANPLTILSFIGVFAGMGIGSSGGATGIVSGALLVVGVFLGSATWWLLLSTGASWLGAKLHPTRLRFVNLFSGSLILAFGAWQLTSPLLTRWR